MDRGTIGVLAVVALVAVAGCSGLTGSDDPTETDAPSEEMAGTDAPTSNGTSGEDGTTTGDGPTLDDVAYPAGATADGFDNASAVTQGHRETLAGSGYALSLQQATTTGNQSEDISYAARSNPDSERRAGSLRTASSENRWFWNATHEHANVTANGQSNVQVRERSGDFATAHRQDTLSSTVRSVLVSGNFTAVEAVERNGETAVRYELDEYNESASGTLRTDTAGGSVVIGESGVVYDAALSVTGTSEGSDVSLDLTYEVTGTGDVTVERPDWTDDA